MKKLSESVLFYICEECRSPVIIPREGEFILLYLHNLNCDYCNHSHKSIEKLVNYSRATRGYV